jgi:hypothetical protein
LALKLLDTAEADVLNRLFAIYQERTSHIFIEELSARLDERLTGTARSAAASIARLGDLTASDLNGLTNRVREHLRLNDIDDLALIIALGDGRPGLIRDMVLEAIPMVGWLEIARHHSDGSKIYDPISESPQWLQSVMYLFGPRRTPVRTVGAVIQHESKKIGQLELRSIVQTSGPLSGLKEVPSDRPDWNFIKSVIRFSEEPSRAHLVAALELAKNLRGEEVAWAARVLATWPLAQALESGRRSGSWDEIVSHAAEGRFGDVEVWQAREESLLAGLSLNDLRDDLDLFDAAANLQIELDDEAVTAFLDLMENNIPKNGRQGLLLLPNALLNAVAWRRHGSKVRPPWVDRVVKILLQEREYSFFALMLIDDYGVGDESPDWETYLFNLPLVSMRYFDGVRLDSFVDILVQSWGRTRDIRLLPGFAICAQLRNIDPALLPPVDSILCDDVDCDTLRAALVIGLRKGGDLAPLLGHIERIANGEAVLVDALLMALKAYHKDTISYARQVLTLHHALSDMRVDAAAYTFAELRRLAASRRSDLFDEGVWRELSFPQSLRLVMVEHLERREGGNLA